MPPPGKDMLENGGGKKHHGREGKGGVAWDLNGERGGDKSEKKPPIKFFQTDGGGGGSEPNGAVLTVTPNRRGKTEAELGDIV